MPRKVSLVLLTLVGGSSLFCTHYYLWARLVRDVGFNPIIENLLTAFTWVMGASIPMVTLTSRMVKPQTAIWWVKPVYTWMGASFLLLVSVVLVDLLRLGYEQLSFLPATNALDSLSRARLVAVAATALGLGTTVIAFREAARLEVKRVDITLANLPPGLNGTSIVQLSDIHVGPTVGRAFVSRIVAQVNALRPDIVAITGDLVDGSVENLAYHVAPLQDLEAQHGTYFVTGNHEYYSGATAWCLHLSELGIRVLRNEHVKLGPVGRHLHLAGVDDLHANHFNEPGHGLDLQRAVEGRDPGLPLILLAHQPKVAAEASQHGVDLQLSGHTHGGQLWPLKWLVRLNQPVVAGLKRFGQTLVYVSCGTGSGGPPMRLKATPEITHIRLYRA